jgi:hypothetical protein
MSRETTRRAIAIALLTLLAAVALRSRDGSTAGLTLAPIVALLVPVVRFYFPPGRRDGARRRREARCRP